MWKEAERTEVYGSKHKNRFFSDGKKKKKKQQLENTASQTWDHSFQP